MLHTSSVFSSLSASSRAEPLHALDLGDGRASAVWRNSHDRMSYERANGHTLSCYLKGGDGTRRIDAGSVQGWQGALCIMPQGASSQWEITDTTDFVHLYVSDAELRRLFSETFDRDARLMVIPETTFGEAPQLAGALGALAQATRTGDRLRAEQALATAVGHLFLDPRYGGAKVITLRGGLAPALRRRLIEHIEASLHRTITLQELAGLAGLSEFHLQRMFRVSCGVSPHRFILNRRIDRARCMLGGADPVAQIAAACGFSSQSHLTRMFKAVTGITPAAYRRCIAGH